jgi:hypothetical protein
LEQGPTEQFIIEQAIRNRVPIPDKIANAPILQPGLVFYYKAYLTLSSCRASGWTEGRIPWLAANEYAKRYDLDEEEFDILWTLVCEMDTVYIRHQQKRAKIAPGKGKQSAEDTPKAASPPGPRIIRPPRKTR